MLTWQTNSHMTLGRQAKYACGCPDLGRFAQKKKKNLLLNEEVRCGDRKHFY